MADTLDDATLKRLSASIDANNLLLLCGAGVSMPPPSRLFSAVRVAQSCYDAYHPIEELPTALRDDIAALAAHFYSAGQMQSVFLRNLVPWDELVGQFNAGHEAIGDLLATRAVTAALSTNFDTMIEQWAKSHKIAMLGAVEPQEAAPFANRTAPLLKLHGCMDRTREKTLWTVRQLGDPVVATRLSGWANWISLNLPGKDLLVVGFWTDWQYLNAVVGDVLAGHGLASAVVVDPSSAAALQAKAPELWGSLQAAGTFTHVQASGDQALEELRVEFSRVWLKKFFRLGKPLIDASGTPCSPAAYEPPPGPVRDLYDLRRDAEGVPFSRAARTRGPAPATAQAAFAHLLLRRANATPKGPWYEQGGKSVRVINGAGELLSAVRERYVEPPSLVQPDIVVCAGATDIGVPASIIPSGRGASTVRPAPGGTSQWVTLETAQAELQL